MALESGSVYDPNELRLVIKDAVLGALWRWTLEVLGLLASLAAVALLILWAVSRTS